MSGMDVPADWLSYNQALREVERLKAQLATARELVGKRQWTYSDWGSHCDECGYREQAGHKSDCPVGCFLAETEVPKILGALKRLRSELSKSEREKDAEDRVIRAAVAWEKALEPSTGWAGGLDAKLARAVRALQRRRLPGGAK